MSLVKINKIFVLIIIGTFIFQCLGLPSKAHAKWQDRSDELPGMNEEPSPLLYVALGTAAIAVVYMIVKFYKNKKTKTGDDKVGQLNTSSVVDNEIPSHEQAAVNAVNNDEQKSIEPYIGFYDDDYLDMGHASSSTKFKDKTMVMGLTVNF